jgi:hypothetical protein
VSISGTNDVPAAPNSTGTGNGGNGSSETGGINGNGPGDNSGIGPAPSPASSGDTSKPSNGPATPDAVQGVNGVNGIDSTGDGGLPLPRFRFWTSIAWLVVTAFFISL